MTAVTPAEATLHVAEDMKTVQVTPFGRGHVAAFSMRCPARAEGNEDAAALLPYADENGVLVVADGAGGVQGGAQASRITVETLRDGLAAGARSGQKAREAILDGIEAANQKVLSLGIGAATTVAAVEIGPERVRSYHVGDSQILLQDARGELKFLTTSHSPVGYAERSGLFNEEEALGHLDRHYVSNVIGLRDMSIEVGAETRFERGDTLLLACDGLYDNLTQREIQRILRGGRLEERTWELVRTCVERMLNGLAERPCKPDDLTVLVYRLDDSE